ncbi:hypothetical protein DVH24_010041 [Malus domestica]|uniref:Uncharacterized protein n=1 Tax=Malus domestica TaxID=3750 RepID=A0A498JRP2_MALDO|nr:hypothetical protein DVH24_010041 [Malus domestica]
MKVKGFGFATARQEGFENGRAARLDFRPWRLLTLCFSDNRGGSRKFDVEVRDEEKNEGGDEGNVLDLDADADAEFKTMKELIDLELEKKKGASRDLKDILGDGIGFEQAEDEKG